MAEFYGRGCAPERRCLPRDEWPAECRERWLAAIAKGDLLDGSGSRGHVRQITNSKIEKGFGRFLTFVVNAGLDVSAVFRAEGVCGDIVHCYVKELEFLQNSPATIVSRLQELHDGLVAMYPGLTSNCIKIAAKKVRREPRSGEGKRAKMVAADELFGLGLHLMEVARHRSTARLGAIDFRDGLIIASLALRPLRLHNFAALKIGHSLIFHGESYRIVFDKHSMKNGSPFEAPWPLPLTDLLRRWIETHRPVLIRCRGRWSNAPDDHLWISSHGSAMTQQALYDRICSRTKAQFGRAVNPHLFRDVAATTLAIEDPKHIRLAAPLLSHRDFRVTERHYLQARMLVATCHYQAELLKRRRSRK